MKSRRETQVRLKNDSDWLIYHPIRLLQHHCVKPVKDLVAEIENLSGENKMLVDLLKNEKHQLQEELQKYKEIQQNLQVKASKLTKSMLVTGLRC